MDCASIITELDDNEFDVEDKNDKNDSVYFDDDSETGRSDMVSTPK
jgi:hypothetical protein